jgi:PKD repeat protein
VIFVAHAQNPQTTISIDAAAGLHPISKYIYGMAYAGTALQDLNCPIQRYGGNNTTRYNWQINADNRGSDWFFESIGDNSSTAAERIDTFVSQSQAAGAQSMVTIPMIGWVAKLGSGRAKLASFSIAKYGAQTGSDQWFPDAGTGILTSGQDVTGNDPNDANVPADSTFHKGLVQHEFGVFGSAASGGLRYYLLDNESSIWHATHRDVHPVGATMDEIKTKILDYAGMIKSVDSTALVVGPEEWGWSGYFFSGYDQQWGSQHGWSNLPDRANHGGQDYLPWLLDQLHQNDTTTGKRLLDVFSVHYYPQGGEFGNDTSTAMQLTRNQSTRSLWDPNYVDKSWINDKVQLIPRLKGWVSTHYPGTLIAVTEYNWGAEGHINGATTQADIFGIFGREGLDIGSRWTTPDPSTPTYNAIKMYRNYDGQKSTFGDTSVQDLVANPDNLSSFAAVRTSDGALTVMVINKVLSGQTPAAINVANFSGKGVAQVWQLTSANAITRLADLQFSGNSFTATVPPQSITLFVIPAGSAADEPPTAVLKATPTSGTAPLMVAFDGTGSTDPDGAVSSYAWDFGDGSSGSGGTVNHQYTNAGSYTARLTVNDTSGSSASATATISVNAPSCTFSLSSTKASFRPKGGTGSLTVTAPQGCGWTSSGAPTWITVTSGSGAGSGSFSYTVARNTGGRRTATLTIAGLAFTVSQSAPRLATVGLYAPSSGAFFLRDSNSTGFADTAFSYGPSGLGWTPLVGDWNGDGTDTVGLYDPAHSTFFLRNSNTAGFADIAFAFGVGGLGWIPIAGDWDGDGVTTVGLYNPATAGFFLRNSNTTGIADLSFTFGPAGQGWLPIAGDWDEDGTTTIGVYNPATGQFMLRNSNSAGPADMTFSFGPGGFGWEALTGDWASNGLVTPGLYAPSSGAFFLRNSNSSGVADIAFAYGPGGLGWKPIVGDWTGQ